MSKKFQLDYCCRCFKSNYNIGNFSREFQQAGPLFHAFNAFKRPEPKPVRTAAQPLSDSQNPYLRLVPSHRKTSEHKRHANGAILA